MTVETSINEQAGSGCCDDAEGVVAAVRCAVCKKLHAVSDADQYVQLFGGILRGQHRGVIGMVRGEETSWATYYCNLCFVMLVAKELQINVELKRADAPVGPVARGW